MRNRRTSFGRAVPSWLHAPRSRGAELRKGSLGRLGRELLASADAAWFRMGNPGDPADVGAILVFEGPLDDARLRAALEKLLLAHPRFRRRIVESRYAITRPRWEAEEDFSLDAHLSRRTLAASGDAALAELLDTLMSEPLDLRRSPWHMWIIDRGAHGTALFTRVHHAMGDGFALLDVLLSIADSEGASGGPKAAHPVGPPRARGFIDEVAASTRRAGNALYSLARVLLLPFDPPTRLRGTTTGVRRVAWSEPIPLSRIKQLTRAHHGTVNDVLVAAVAGALRRYLILEGDEAVAIRAIVPVNLRPAWKPVDFEHGNWFGLVFLDLPVKTSDRRARIGALEREMDRIKRSAEASVSLAVLSAIGRVPAALGRFASVVLARKGTLVVTNLRGPTERLRIAGQPLADICFWAPHPCGLACGVSILSYAGSVRVGIRTDAAVIPDPDELVRCFSEEIAALAADVDRAERAPEERA